MIYSIEEKVQIIKWLYSGSTPHEIPNRFSSAFEDRPVPSAETAYSIIKKFEATGCVTNCKNCVGDKTQQTQKRKDIDSDTVQDDLSSSKETHKSDRDQDTGEIDSPNNRYKHPKIPKLQEISPEDKLRRLEFCYVMLKEIDENKGFMKNILFTGQSVFAVCGYQTPAEIRYWVKQNTQANIPIDTQTNTQVNIPTDPQNSQKVCVWAGILNNSVIGPIFIDGYLNSEKYLHILKENIIPSIKALDLNFNTTWLQHDGLPAHNAKNLTSFLENAFSKRIIGLNGSIVWPSRSADLSPNSFFIWGYIKQKVYTNVHERPKNISELRAKITEVLQSITPDMLDEVRQEFLNRLKKCQAQQGGEVNMCN